MKRIILVLSLVLSQLIHAQNNELMQFWRSFSDYNIYLLDYTWELMEESQLKITDSNHTYPVDEFNRKKDSLLKFKDAYIDFLEEHINNSEVFVRATEVSPFVDKTLKFLDNEVATLVSICDGQLPEGNSASVSYSEVLVQYYALKREFSVISERLKDDFPTMGNFHTQELTTHEVPHIDYIYSPGDKKNVAHLDSTIVPLKDPVDGNLFNVGMQIGLWKNCENQHFEYFVYLMLDKSNGWVSNKKPVLASRLCDIQYQMHVIACESIDAYLMQLQGKCEMKETDFNEIIMKHYKELGLMWNAFQQELTAADDWEPVILKWEEKLSAEIKG